MIVMSIVACRAVPSDPPPPQLICLPIVEYTPDFQKRVLGELKMLAPDAALRTITADYLQLRDKSRECEKGNK